MSYMRLQFAIVATSIFLVLTATAEAAKGIKNGSEGNGTHTVLGIVVKVLPDKTGYGFFELKTAYNHKKSQAANGGLAANGIQAGGANQQLRKIEVTSSTKFEHHMGGLTNMVNPAALQRGQHVRVNLTGQHANQVHIYTSMHMGNRRMSNNFMRHRTSAYHPYHRYRRF